MDKVKCKCECTCDECGAECNDIVYSKSNIPEEKLYTEKVIKDLQAENEQIKKDYAKLHIDFAKCNEENERLKEEKDGMQILINGYIELTEKYKQALQEIRAIAERAFVVCDDDCGNANRFTDILDKINEVIGVE